MEDPVEMTAWAGKSLNKRAFSSGRLMCKENGCVSEPEDEAAKWEPTVSWAQLDRKEKR